MEEGDGGPRRGLLGVFRVPHLLIVLLLFSAFTVQADALVCKDQFTPTPDTNVGSTLVFNRNVAELEAEGSTLLDLQWPGGVFGTPLLAPGSDSDLATKYLAVTEDDVAGTMKVAVLKELKGLPDYPDRRTTLVLLYTFPVTAAEGGECVTRMVFTLLDQNTARPTLDQTSYSATVREDFPAQYTIPNLQVMATDLDGTSPNNLLVVSFDKDCPLNASRSSYDAQGGVPVPITFVLTQKLDYDTMGVSTVVTCSVKVSDSGTNPEALFATVVVQITVEPFNDETPQFDHPIYNTQLDGLEIPPNPLTVLPAGLHATDADKPPQELAYAMAISSGEDSQWNDFFSVDATSGEVTQTQVIDPDLLGKDYSIHFIVTVRDDGGAKSTTVLEIVLPTAPTTSTTSTTALTTTPSPTTTTTTSTTTTTAPTTTTTTTEPPSTTTCTPCDTTPQTTWTTPLETTTSTTTTSTTIPTSTPTSTTTNPATTSTTTNLATTEPVKCEPCTTEIVTCPTIESTTSTTEGGSQTSTLEITPSSFSPTDSPVSSSESSSSPLPSIQSTDSLGTSPTPNPTSPQTGGTSTPEDATCPTTGSCEPCECSTTPTGSTDGTTTTVDPSATTTTVDPSATTTTTGSQTFTASVASSSATSVASSASTPFTSTASDDPLPSSSITVPQTTTTTTTTEEPTNPQYRFQFQAYHFQPFTTTTVVGYVRVVQDDGSSLGVDEIVTYYWAPESPSKNDGFTMDQTTGYFSMNGASTDIYRLVAKAVVNGGTSLLADVTITVVEPVKCDNTFFIAESLITTTVSETQYDVLIAQIKTQVDDADKYCITEVIPEDYCGYFSVDNQGNLTLESAIDADPDGGRVVTVRVEAQKATDPCPKKPSGGDLYRNEVLVQVTIEDLNDQKPSLLVPSSGNTPTRVGYPSNRGLQQVVGPVMTLKANDGDTVGSLNFTISGDSANLFVVQTDTATDSGALYLLNHETCGDKCDVTVTVTDGINTADGQKIEVHSLDFSQIYDISLESMSPEEMVDYVNELSDATELDLHLLYFSLSDSSPARRVRMSPHSAQDEFMVFTKRDSSVFNIQERDLENGVARTLLNEGARRRRIQRRDLGSTNLDGSNEVNGEEKDSASSWTSLAHIYGFQADGSLVPLDVLNSALAEQQDHLHAIEFSEKETFDPTGEVVSLSGWKAAVGVLGALVGLMLLASLLGFVWYRRRQRKSPAAKSGSPMAVNTIGSAYPNHGYEVTAMDRLDSTSTSSDDSVNKNSAFKKAMGHTNGNSAGDANNNDKHDTGKTTTVEIMANPFTSVNVPDSPSYEDPVDFSSPPRSAILHTSTSSPQTRTRDPSPYASSVKSSPPIYEGPDSDSESRDALQAQQGGLRRITPGPLPDRARSSPYLTKSEGDYESFRPSDTQRVASFTPYKGGEGKGNESPTLSSKPSSPLPPYKPLYKPEAFSYLDDVPRREVKDTAEKKDMPDSPKKQTKLDTSPYAFPVRTKKEPPNPALATPSKPIMKGSRDVSTSAEVHRSADDPASSSVGFASLKGSPISKQKADERERKSSLKYYTSEGETSDSELKKSVAFKVLVDEKHIKRRKEDKEKEDEKAKKGVNYKGEDEVQEETEDL